MLRINIFKRCGLLAVAMAGLLALNAQAALEWCMPATASKVTNTSACQYSTTETQDFLSDPLTVNSESFFGASDWVYFNKDDGIESSSGNWQIDASQWSVFDDIMLVFKGGQNPLVGYLANNGATAGTWNSPFTVPEFNLPGQSQMQNVSHITYYGRGTPAEVPEPSLLVLLMLGLGSVALGRRRAR